MHPNTPRSETNSKFVKKEFGSCRCSECSRRFQYDAICQSLMSNSASSSCRNCGAALTGAFCSQCGQRDIDYHQSIRTVFRDFLDSFLAFDGKVIQTLWLLLSRPGELTIRFLQGQQIRFLNPIRFYVSVSLVFFLVLHFVQPNAALVVVKGDGPAGHGANAISNEQTAGEDQQFEA